MGLTKLLKVSKIGLILCLTIIESLGATKWPTVQTGSLFRGYTIIAATSGQQTGDIPTPPPVTATLAPTPVTNSPALLISPAPVTTPLPPLYNNPQKIISNSLFDILSVSNPEIDSNSFYYNNLNHISRRLGAVQEEIELPPKRHLWLQTTTSSSHVLSSSEIIGYRNHYLGITIGADQEFENNWRFGFSYTRGNSTIKT